MLRVIYEGENLIISEDQLDGYKGCEVLGKATEEDIADCPYKMVSREHLLSVHLQKALEATLVLSGYNLTVGLLAEEASANKIPLKELAQIVLDKRKAEREFEVARRVKKQQGD